jgi:hypothetical protein
MIEVAKPARTRAVSRSRAGRSVAIRSTTRSVELETRRVAPMQVFHQQRTGSSSLSATSHGPTHRSFAVGAPRLARECTPARAGSLGRGDEGHCPLGRQPGGPQSLLNPPNPISR